MPDDMKRIAETIGRLAASSDAKRTSRDELLRQRLELIKRHNAEYDRQMRMREFWDEPEEPEEPDEENEQS